MKLRGDDVWPMGVGPELVKGCEATRVVEGVRRGLTPLAEMGEASWTGFMGKLVS